MIIMIIKMIMMIMIIIDLNRLTRSEVKTISYHSRTCYVTG